MTTDGHPHPSSGELLEHARNVNSQFGEDGILETILATLPTRDHWCVEFGAWDGCHLSNTKNLIDHHGYRAVLIEADKNRFDRLCKNFPDRRLVTPINAFVGFSASDRLDKLLEKTDIPKDFDFLSIDIDGNDYHAWNAVTDYRPKVVCVEYNPTIPTGIHFVQAANPAIQHGNSLTSLVELATSKGYELICVLPVNAIFVRKADFPVFEIRDNRPETLRKDESLVTQIFSGYDGTVFLRGCQKLPWHLIDLDEMSFQRIPRFLRTSMFEGSRSRHLLTRFVSQPIRTVRKALSRVVHGARNQSEHH